MQKTNMEPVTSDDHYQMIKPQLCGLLDLLRVGVVFDRAKGDYLCHQRDGEEVAVLDLVGGYGSLLFGHHHPALVAEAQRLLAEGRPIHSQGSRHALAGQLARELSRRAGGDYRVVSATRAPRRSRPVWHAILETVANLHRASKRAFTARRWAPLTTANQDYREPFLIDGITVHRVRINDTAHLEQTSLGPAARRLDSADSGGSGVGDHAGFAQRAAYRCRARRPADRGFIQTGMGRTGTFLACGASASAPITHASKALGGGLENFGNADPPIGISTFDVPTQHLRRGRLFQRRGASRRLSCWSGCPARPKGERLLTVSEPDGEVPRRLSMLRPRADGRRRVRPWAIRVSTEAAQQSGRSIFVRGVSLQHPLHPAGADAERPQTLRLEPSLHYRPAIDHCLGALEDVCAKLRSTTRVD